MTCIGISPKQMFATFRGKSTYQAEFDVHFPTLTMRETLDFACKARTPKGLWSTCPSKVDEEADTLGLTKALDTNMGNALVPGVSGGERKRTTIAVGVFSAEEPDWTTNSSGNSAR